MNLGRGGCGGSSGTEGVEVTGSALPERLGAGGGGGAEPLLLALPVSSDPRLPPGGGGGGGARACPAEDNGGGGDATWGWAFCCSSLRKSTINSWFSLMKSSVKPLSCKSCPKCSRHRGSKASSSGNSEAREPFKFIEEREALCDMDGGRLVRGDSGGVGADECR